MPKTLSDYTDQELIEIGRKTVQQRLRDSERNKEKAEVMKQLWARYKEGKIKV